MMVALSWESLVVAAVVGIAAGVLIGCIGVGGVIIVPLLLLRRDIDVHLAVVACMAAYVPAGLAGAAAYVRKGAVPWRHALLMCLPSPLAALLGSWTLVRLSAHLVKVVLYSVMLATSCLSGVRSIHAALKERREKKRDLYVVAEDTGNRQEQQCSEQCGAGAIDGSRDIEDDAKHDDSGTYSGGDDDQRAELIQPAPTSDSSDSTDTSPVADAGDGEVPCFGPITGVELVQALLVGTLTGFGSALTGTSGPVLLLPMLFILMWPALPALGCAQLIQVPIALAATIGNAFFATSQVDLVEVVKLAGCVAAGLVPFVFVGAAIANYLPQRTLKLVVAILLVVASLVLLLREVL